MPETDAQLARRDRNAALIEAMLLAAIADGKVSEREMEVLLARVLERPEFEGTQAEELNALVEASARKLAASRTSRASSSRCATAPGPRHPHARFRPGRRGGLRRAARQ